MMLEALLFFIHYMSFIVFFLYLCFRPTEIDGFGIKGRRIFDAVGIVTGLIAASAFYTIASIAARG